MKGHQIIALMVTIVAIFIFSGCSTVDSFLPEDFCAKPINPTMARIEFTRIWQLGGAAGPIGIYDNDQPIGNIGPGAKICWDRFPGSSTIVGRNVYNPDWGANNWRVEIDAKANTVYYVKGGIFGKWSVSLTPD